MQLIHLPEAENDNIASLTMMRMAGTHGGGKYDFPAYRLTTRLHLSYAGHGAERFNGLAQDNLWDRLAVAALTSLQSIKTEIYK